MVDGHEVANENDQRNSKCQSNSEFRAGAAARRAYPVGEPLNGWNELS
jgi:hypothetical protein